MYSFDMVRGKEGEASYTLIYVTGNLHSTYIYIFIGFFSYHVVGPVYGITKRNYGNKNITVT